MTDADTMTSRNSRTKGMKTFVALLCAVLLCVVLAAACSGSDDAQTDTTEAASTAGPTVPATGPAAPVGDPLDVTISGSQENHSGELRWSLLEPLDRDTVQLAPEDETDNDTFAFSWRRPDLIDVQLDLPDGDTFSQQAQVVTGSLSRLDGVRHELVIATDGFTLEEAEQELLSYAERFGLDEGQIAAWKTKSEAFFSGDTGTSNRNSLNLSGVELDYLTVSASAVANASTDDAAIYWYFDWVAN